MHDRNFRLYRLQLDFDCNQEGLGELPLTYTQALKCFESGVSLESAFDICRDVFSGIDFETSYNLAEKDQ